MAATGSGRGVSRQARGRRTVGVVRADGGKALLGTSFRVGASRGRRIDWPTMRFALTRQPGWLVATAHPSSVLRSRQRDADLAALVADLEVARDLLC